MHFSSLFLRLSSFSSTSLQSFLLVHEAQPSSLFTTGSSPLPVEKMAEWTEGVDLLYHEATYAEAEAALAERYGHSTARQAALVAKAAHAHRLLLGHFSSRYADERVLLQEAQEVFPNTLLALEGLRLSP